MSLSEVERLYVIYDDLSSTMEYCVSEIELLLHEVHECWCASDDGDWDFDHPKIEELELEIWSFRESF